MWAPNGIVAGFLLASIVFVGVAMLPEDQLLSWGWRVPFWASIAVVAIGYMIRRRLDEPTAFREASAEQQLAESAARRDLPHTLDKRPASHVVLARICGQHGDRGVRPWPTRKTAASAGRRCCGSR